MSSSDSSILVNFQSKKVKERICELIKFSKELRFLVGFFYFSGINELYESLKEHPDIQLDILVGLNVDTHTRGLIEYEDPEYLSGNEKIENFFESITKSFNDTQFDTRLFHEQVQFYLEQIKKGKLRIRKTREPNHSKLYLFKMADQYQLLSNSSFIIGSSNLTKAGLSSQSELNIEIKDHGVQEMNEYFSKLWENAIPISENHELQQKLIHKIEKHTMVAQITPFEAYGYIMKNYLDSQAQAKAKESLRTLLERRNYKPYQYQLDAVAQAMHIINSPEMPNGVIVSDVVGLGKSIIASLIAKSLNKRGVIICPPGLIGDDNKQSGWQKYREDFELYDWDIRSCGLENLKKTLELVKETEEYEVIIIDEVHRFRNQDTEAYDVLANICRNRIVILLSATPFNNTPADIFSLLKLFVVPGKSMISLDNDLANRFRIYNRSFHQLSYIRKNYLSTDKKKSKKAQALYEDLFQSPTIDIQLVKQRIRYLSHSIRSVIEPVVIRRNRIDLQKDPIYSKEIYALSSVKDPEELFFELSPEQSSFYDEITKDCFSDSEYRRFKGAIYQPFYYEEGEVDSETISIEKNREKLSQTNLYDFMRRLLVKRFESSFGAFRQSLENFYHITEKVQQFIERSGNKFILDRKLIESIYEADEEEIFSALEDYEKLLEAKEHPKNYKVYDINHFKLKMEFLRDIESDKQLFADLIKQIDELKLVDHDPKYKRLVQALQTIHSSKPQKGEPERKVIIFTEYIDTAKYLEAKLSKDFPIGLISSADGLSSNKLSEILGNFDASLKKQKNDYWILLTSDRLSEGVNLNRAGAIINYDIPWNPTRVIQRVGRINRIGKKVFNELAICNFFPTLQGAEYVKSREIAAEKMFMIHTILGEDAKIFDPEEEPTAAGLFKRLSMNPEQLEQESFHTRVRRLYAEIKECYPHIYHRIQELPQRIKVAKKYSEDQLFVFIKKGLGFYTRQMTPQGKVEESPFDLVFDHIIACPEDPRQALSIDFWDRYEKTKNYKDPVRIPPSDVSLEKKARNNLSTLISNPILDFESYLGFARMLLRDINDYKTLSEFTLRKLASLKTENPKAKDIQNIQETFEKLMDDLGSQYLDKLISKLNEAKSEVIIAIENQKEQAQ